MKKQGKLNQETIVKAVFGVAVIATLGLSLRLSKTYALVDNVKKADDKGANIFSTDHLALIDNPTPRETEKKYAIVDSPDFTRAAEMATPAVVHIAARREARIVKRNSVSPFEELIKHFFGENSLYSREYEQPAQEGQGSGVICSPDGLIITNFHVVKHADSIEVTLSDNRIYSAKLIGDDPESDLALLKIEEHNLPILKFGDSDKLKVGDWVLAIGNPFNFNSTVTKGIVSSKSRSLDEESGHICKNPSYIQTDVALNMGNSGGALVNLQGELVGINNAIYSPSRSFVGYSFSIPSSVVKKVIGDLREYGMVQRNEFPLSIKNIDHRLARKLGLKYTVELLKKLGLKSANGVYVWDIPEKGPYARLFKKGDVIIEVNGHKINNRPELLERVTFYYRPGDKLFVTLIRGGKEKKVEIILSKEPDAIQIIEKNGLLQVEGAIFQNIDHKTKEKLNISAGVLIKEVPKGRFQDARLKKGDILLSFEKQPIKNITALAEMIRRATGSSVRVEVMDPDTFKTCLLEVNFKSSLDNKKNAPGSAPAA